MCLVFVSDTLTHFTMQAEWRAEQLKQEQQMHGGVVSGPPPRVVVTPCHDGRATFTAQHSRGHAALSQDYREGLLAPDQASTFPLTAAVPAVGTCIQPCTASSGGATTIKPSKRESDSSQVESSRADTSRALSGV